MRQAVIVSTARTPIGKTYRGAFDKRLVGHALPEGRRRGARYPVPMCIGAGMGTAGPIGVVS
ncbi:hypothetical protein [Streptomyces sp. NPDC051636]|uniref:hypothetical protein n=1 Tax=Streptomyces sp. NPDC051636 TaxID=3365663 RepID=UPI00378A3DCD